MKKGNKAILIIIGILLTIAIFYGCYSKMNEKSYQRKSITTPPKSINTQEVYPNQMVSELPEGDYVNSQPIGFLHRPLGTVF
jgi:LPS O-antigen subunit length determinant protein (WzzB/FepE family)